MTPTTNSESEHQKDPCEALDGAPPKLAGAGQSEFDSYAAQYDVALAQGLSASGEDKDYFAQGRIAWLKGRLSRLSLQPKSALDFGCGTGSATPFLFEMLGIETILGVDISTSSLEVARRLHGSEQAQFLPLEDYNPNGQIDLAFCNGVFHHIPVSERAAAIDCVFRALRPGGLFAFWENNPWNPGTRYVMSRIPFDRDAVTLTPPEARGLLRTGGFEILRTDCLFIFPRSLAFLRGLEPLVAGLPLGAQYQILCRKGL